VNLLEKGIQERPKRTYLERKSSASQERDRGYKAPRTKRENFSQEIKLSLGFFPGKKGDWQEFQGGSTKRGKPVRKELW